MGKVIEDFYSGPSYLEPYFKSLPNLYDNPVGQYLHDCVVTQLKMSVEGTVRYPVALETTYKDWFFKGVSELPGQKDMVDISNIAKEKWTQYSVVYVCETIYNVTNNVRECVNIDLVNKDKRKLHVFLRGAESYRSVLAVCSNPVQEAYRGIPQEMLKVAKDDYKKSLTNPSWVYNKIALYEAKKWKDADWELYHHWNKLMLLGASESEVSEIISDLKNMGLTIDEVVDDGVWHGYNRWMKSASEKSLEISWNDFSEAKEGMLCPVCYPNGVIVHEHFASSYMYDEKCGKRYYVEPPQPEISCFSADTMVRMANGELRKISEIHSGDRIITPQGEKCVLFVSTPLRGKRSLYSFGNHAFKFSGSHPFRSGKGHTCVHPDFLCHFIPTFEQVGLLTEGTKLITHSGREAEVAHLYTHACEEYNKNELLYDIIPEADESGVFEYYVGDEKEQYLVSSEMPVLTGREQETIAFVKMFDIIADPMLQASANLSTESYWEQMYPAFHLYIKKTLLPKLGELDLNDIQDCTKFTLPSSLFSEYVEMFEDRETNIRIGYLFSALFATLLPVFFQVKISLDNAEAIGNMIKADIMNGILKF